MLFTDTNLELSKKGDNKVIISHGLNLLIEDEANPLTIKSTNYGNDKEIKIPHGMQFEATDEYLIIHGKNTSGTLKATKIPWE
jgi:hypothetical protein